MWHAVAEGGGQMAKKKKAKAKKKLSPEEKLQRRIQRKLYRDFQTCMSELGVSKIRADGMEIVVDGRTGELDDIFVYKNVLILVEYTVGKPDSAHILKKKPLFDKIQADIPRFLKIAREKYPKLAGLLDDIYDDTHYHLRIAYVPLHEASQETVSACPADLRSIFLPSRKRFICQRESSFSAI